MEQRTTQVLLNQSQASLRRQVTAVEMEMAALKGELEGLQATTPVASLPGADPWQKRVAELEEHSWKGIVLDEAHLLKNHASQRSKLARRLALEHASDAVVNARTGTPAERLRVLGMAVEHIGARGRTASHDVSASWRPRPSWKGPSSWQRVRTRPPP
jgi:hypothetical protein